MNLFQKFFGLIEKELIACVYNNKIYLLLAFNFLLVLYMMMNLGKFNIDFLIFFMSLWFLNNGLLDLLVYREKIKGKIRFAPGFGYRIFEVIISKSFFITFISIVIASLFLCIYHLVYSIPVFTLYYFLPVFFLVDFFIVGFSIFLIFKYEASKGIGVVFISMILLSVFFRRQIQKALSWDYLHLMIIVLFLFANIVLFGILKKIKNEFYN